MNRTGQRGPGSLIARTLLIAALLATTTPPVISGATEPITPITILPDNDEPDPQEQDPGTVVIQPADTGEDDVGPPHSREPVRQQPPPAATSLLIGVQSDIQPDTEPAIRRREIALMQNAGIAWVRIVLNWYAAEPRKGEYNEEYLKDLESLVDEIRGAGMRVMLLVLATPPWANPRGWDAPPLRMRDLGDFVGFAVRRFSSRVKHWEIWNEPDWHEFWKPAPDVRGFVEMLREAYTNGKAADPQATFISGGLAGNNTDYLRQMYALGASPFFEVLGVHPYVFQRSPDVVHPHVRNSFHGLGELRKIMVANGDAAKPIWITEMSWPTNRRAPGATGDWAEGVNQATQAAYLSRAYEKIAAEYPFVQVAMWYNLRDKGTNPTLAYHNYGLVQHNFEPKPAYFALQRQARTAATPVASRP
ncbi:MAG: beta-galactosidase [bacterium]|nr:beta-galactosidase [bacterium]